MKVYVTDSDPDPQVIMMLADKDERITDLEGALRSIRTALHIRVDISASAKERIMAEIERVLPEPK